MSANKQHIDTDELLVKYLAGEANHDERARAELWIGGGEENAKYFEHFKLIWEESEKLVYKSNVNDDVAWDRFKDRLQKRYTEAPRPKYNLQWLKMAAAILIISGLALFGPYFIHHSANTRTAGPASAVSDGAFVKTATTTRIKIDTLPDGSVVTMNKYSTLNYTSTYDGNKRYSALTGEAFFNIKHNAAKPFIVKVNDIWISVLGTSFNVRSNGDTTEVIVETGRVSVKKRQRVIVLNAGEKVTAVTTDNMLVKAPNTSRLYRSYFDKSVISHPKAAASNITKTKPSSVLDFKKHPDLLQKILKDPAKWATILKSYRTQSDDINVRRGVIRDVIADIQNEKLLGNTTVRSFRLNEGEFIINDQRQPDAVHQRFKSKFIKEPGYVIYFGNLPKTTKGIYLQPDSL